MLSLTIQAQFIIGKAQGGRNAVFKEAKNREPKWIICFKRKGFLPETAATTDTAAREYVHTHCRIYVAIMDDEQLLGLIGEAEDA